MSVDYATGSMIDFDFRRAPIDSPLNTFDILMQDVTELIEEAVSVCKKGTISITVTVKSKDQP